MAGARVPSDPLEELPLGAVVVPGAGVRFRVWAPLARTVKLVLERGPRSPIDLAPEGRGYFAITVASARPGDRYWFRLGSARRPDPASRSQPGGLAGPSEVFDPGAFPWTDAAWRPLPLERSVLYELHPGTFTPTGTLDSAIPELVRLAELGVTTVELMPIGEERGEVGWGYGPVFPFAVRRSYGGPRALQRFVDAAHRDGLGVLLDVVFNHWSGTASFLGDFGPYFHPRASTPWGPTPNLEGPGSDEVRRYFFEGSRAWWRDFHLDGFRLDATHEIRDRRVPSFWGELATVARDEAARRSRPIVLIAESELNDVRILRPVADGGWGLDAQWADDFHHALHAALTGERQGYYADYGPLAMLARAFEAPLLFQGQYSVHHDRRLGAPAVGVRPGQFVVYDQNHDQVGNRGDGARLTTLLPEGLAKVALGLVLWSPAVPMLFMGEEYGETRPFYFFVDPRGATARATRRGRERELKALGFPRPPPDPALPSTLEASRLDRSAADTPRGRSFRALVSALLALRRELPALRPGGDVEARAWEKERFLAIRRRTPDGAAVLIANLGEADTRAPRVDWPGRFTARLRSDPEPTAAGPPIEWTPAAPTSPSIPGRSFRVFVQSDPGASGPRGTR